MFLNVFLSDINHSWWPSLTSPAWWPELNNEWNPDVKSYDTFRRYYIADIEIRKHHQNALLQ